MTKNLVIVESPAKAKTIQGYLGKDFKVTSSFGHIRDLPSKKMSVDIKNHFKPEYEVPAEKKKTVNALKKDVKADTIVWLATDEDREGEAIAWHLGQALKLKPAQTRRIVFHEITKTAILSAIDNPRGINQGLVDAQQARRVLDRLVGYELSPVLWRKVRPGLSAGRVQSVAVKLIVEREREIKDFTGEKSFKVSADFKTTKNEELSAALKKSIKNKETAKKILESLANSKSVVKSIELSKHKRNPSPPFTTSTLQQEASRRLGYSVKQTMSIAQKLYEGGAITYMRTDSLSISAKAQASALKYIESTFGSNYSNARNFKTTSKGAQEAHEAIRPTNISREVAGRDAKAEKLYKLIRGRFLSSQMSPALLSRTTITIESGEHVFEAKGEIIEFDGWLKCYPQSFIKDTLVPKLSEGQTLDLVSAQALETLTKPPARYTEASLVKKLEEMGIGRPSTYAPTISTVQDRGYVEKGPAPVVETELTLLELKLGKVEESTQTKANSQEKNKLMPTDTALVVTDFLQKYFKDVVDYDFTAEVEEEFDAISHGKRKWNLMIKSFYQDFHKSVLSTEKVTRKEATQARTIGHDPKTKKPIIARFGRYGPMLQRGSGEDEEKPDFAPLPAGSTLENVKLKDALVMFSLPRVVGTTKDKKEIKANIGRYGPYVQIDSTYASIPKDEDVFTIDLKRALQLIDEQQAKKKKSIVKKFSDTLVVKRGRFGPFVTDGKFNAKIPKDMKPESISQKQAEELLKKKAQA